MQEEGVVLRDFSRPALELGWERLQADEIVQQLALGLARERLQRQLTREMRVLPPASSFKRHEGRSRSLR